MCVGSVMNGAGKASIRRGTRVLLSLVCVIVGLCFEFTLFEPVLGDSPEAHSGVPALPRTYIDTTYKAPTDKVLNASTSQELQAALGNAHCVDAVQLTAAVTSIGNFVLMVTGNCDD